MAEQSGVSRVVIVGAGQAGGETASALRRFGFDGEIVLVGDEPIAPYQRPPLSKKYLMGDWPRDRLMVKPPEAYADEKITLITGTRAIWLDRAQRKVRLEGGRELAYDALVLATGGKARRLSLPGADLPGVHVLRTIADVDAIREELPGSRRAAIIGAGYIGLEAAAVLRGLGLDVTVIEAAQRPLARVTSPAVSAFFLERHTAEGVRFALSAQAAMIKGEARARAVGLADGSEVAGDIVIAGIGILPDCALAESAGLTIEDGVLVDAAMRTSDPAIYAVGDCARRPMMAEGRTARLESVHNALETAKIAASSIMGLAPPPLEAPWFWSDQYDVKLQIAGLLTGHDQAVMRADPASGSFAMFYLRGGRLIAVDAVNRPAEYLGGKRLIESAATVAPADLMDQTRPFKQIMTSALGA